MRLLLFPLAAFTLTACSAGSGEPEGADDFAGRIGEGGPPAVASADTPKAVETVSAVPPAGADLTRLQSLGDVSAVDLGPSSRNCTLVVDGETMMVASAPSDRAIPGKAVVRLGDTLTIADAATGGSDAVAGGTSFTGEGYTVTVTPETGSEPSRPADVTVRDAAGKTQSYSGKWTCA